MVHSHMVGMSAAAGATSERLYEPLRKGRDVLLRNIATALPRAAWAVAVREDEKGVRVGRWGCGKKERRGGKSWITSTHQL